MRRNKNGLCLICANATRIAREELLRFVSVLHKIKSEHGATSMYYDDLLRSELAKEWREDGHKEAKEAS